MKRHIIYILLACLTTSCNDWLDVKSETEAKEEDIFSKKSGFSSVLTGIYMSLAETDAYGERLTMADAEQLANLWYCTGYDYNPGYYYLHKHEYTNDYCKENVKAFYASLFNTITQVNVLLKNLSEKGALFASSPQLKNVIEGEAYAIRAYCQADVLRLFGQLPQGLGNRQVSLPYSYTTAITEIPAYYDFEAYVQRLMSDLDAAIERLKTYDPACKYSLAELSSATSVTLDDSYLYYRRQRLNYWAVKALRARLNLYLGNATKAHDEALEVINAKAESGNAVCTLSAESDLTNAYYTLPSECLFSLSKYNVFSYSNSLLLGKSGTQVTPNQHLVLSQSMLTELFRGTAVASNNRYLKLWNRQCTSSDGTQYAALCKYYFDTTSGSASAVYQSLIPMLRLSEMYLIAMECTTDLAEANALYVTYMRDHNTLIESDQFATLADVKDEVVKEYRREFIGEGQMFFVYKRLFAKSMLWADSEMSESDYILPLPDSEYGK